jgi:hypothetical protein
MQQQNFKNHMRKAPQVYYLGMFLTLMSLIITITTVLFSLNGLMNLDLWVRTSLPIFFAFVCISLILIGFYARSFALKAQDRAIRAEENLRYFSMTGKLLDKRLSISQIIALRFASDEEFVALTQKAASENLSNKQIKQEIKNWRADYYRV